jgi:hypothetical protein
LMDTQGEVTFMERTHALDADNENESVTRSFTMTLGEGTD